MTHDQEYQEPPVELAASTRMSAQDFFMWGMNNVVFIRDVPLEKKPLFGVFSADGTQIAYAYSRGEAQVWARQNELEPLSVH
jgi:hypothetical protein